MKLSLTDLIRRRQKNLLTNRLGGRLLIIDTQKNEIRMLNSTASLIWKLLASPKTVTAIISEVGRRFKVRRQRLTVDVCRFIESYVKIGVLERVLN